LTPVARSVDWLGAALNVLAFGAGCWESARSRTTALLISSPVRCCSRVAAAQSWCVAPWAKKAAILPVDLFAHRVFALSAITAFLSFIAQALAFVSLPFRLGAKFGRGQLQLGLLMSSWRAAVAVLPADASDLSIGIRTAICRAGFGIFLPPNLKALMDSVPRERSDSASGVTALARLFGQAIGAALVALSLRVGGAQGGVLALLIGAASAGAACGASALRLAERNGTRH
jgi:DHA2 family multidrug resistance protein-like MFS transporter